jgi:sugar lactone lactonase YvrE
MTKLTFFLCFAAISVGAKTVQMPVECTNPDGMCVDPQGRLVIAAPNNDRKQPGAIFRLDSPGGVPVKWFEVPPSEESGYSSPMGVCFGPDGELYVCDNQKNSKGRLLRIAIEDDKPVKCEVIACGLDNANGVKYFGGRLYLTQAFLYGVKRGDGASSSGLYMFSAAERNVKVGNTPADEQCIFSDVTRNPTIKGGLNGVAIDENGIIYTGNYGDGRVWKLTTGDDGRIVKSEEILHAGGLSVTPDGMCVDDSGNLYIADMRGDALMRIFFSGKLEFLRKGGFVSPSEPCVWKGSVYVANYRGTTLEVVPICDCCRE